MVTELDIKNAVEKGQNTFHIFQQYLEENLGTIRTEVKALKLADIDAEAKEKIDRVQTALNEQNANVKALTEAMAKLNAPGGIVEQKTVETDKVARKAAFDKLLRYGTINALVPEERKHIRFDMDEHVETKALYTADATGGGFLTTPEYVDQLLKNIVLISPMADIVDMRTTVKPWVMTPKRTQTASAVRVSEQATRTETTNPKLGLVQNFPYESYAFTLVSRTDLDDSELDIGAFLMAEFAEQFAKLQGNEFINGLGSAASQAFGFLNDTTINNTIAGTPNGTVTSSTSGQIDYQSLVKLKASLKPGYLPNATWVGTNETLGVLQQMTDSQNRPLWVPFGADTPDTLFSRPYRIMPDMPQTVGNGGSAGALALAFGDFKSGYQGVVRRQVSMQVLNERYADQNAVGFFGYYRFGGTTKISESIKTYRVKP